MTLKSQSSSEIMRMRMGRVSYETETDRTEGSEIRQDVHAQMSPLISERQMAQREGSVQLFEDKLRNTHITRSPDRSIGYTSVTRDTAHQCTGIMNTPLFYRSRRLNI
ncbi:hypothetical protein CBL_03329 [Carabus blaptoides fortunei]